MTHLVDALSLFSTMLLVPVVVGLFLLVLYALLELGGTLREWRERRSLRMVWKTHQRNLATGQTTIDTSPSQTTSYPGLVRVFVNRTLSDGQIPAIARKHADDVEIESSGHLARLSFLIRVGPMLGLMGTLIPLGPALIGLTESNLVGMAEDLVVAFSTTVLGLLVGGIAYAIWLVRRQWYAQDLADIEFLLHSLLRKEQASSAPPLAGDET